MNIITKICKRGGGENGVIITNHAAMRYAERIADKSESDINIYVQRNLAKIEEDIDTMIQHSALIYKGKVGDRDRGAVNVHLSGTWIILTDSSDNKVITLYKVDFDVGEDFNKLYIQRILERIERHKQELHDKQDQIATQRNDYLGIIKENESQIAEYKSAIKKLEKLNVDYKSIIDTMDAECSHLEFAVRKDVEDLMRP